ncbi:hypothetical protein GOBAR_AA30885 [Gossypium barbadense]|uniref:CRAL-TRIO domain-containing protein n=1 Tax=Gossypium barbadense TaxID=3634 RepID=A0A2P5WFD6_GOSBA|nr:hypothetical protein GOBAR_AA30885 [Gossypium barbadense]
MNNGHHQEAIKQFLSLMENVDEKMKNTFQNMHHGYPTETLVRFLKARDWNVQKAHKMKPIIPVDLYRAVRDSQLVGVSGYSKEGHPIIAIGIGLSTYDKASVNYYVQSHIQMNEYRDRVVLPMATEKYGRHISTCLKILDMTGLKLSALNQIKLLSTIATIDDLNYPEKTGTYYIVNAPYIFSACWKAVKPLLQERTKRKIQVLQGCGRDELLKIMDYSSLPHFCRKEGSGSGSGSGHHQSTLIEARLPIKQGSVHVKFPKPGLEDTEIVKTIQSELDRFADQNAVCNSMNAVKNEMTPSISVIKCIATAVLRQLDADSVPN